MLHANVHRYSDTTSRDHFRRYAEEHRNGETMAMVAAVAVAKAADPAAAAVATSVATGTVVVVVATPAEATPAVVAAAAGTTAAGKSLRALRPVRLLDSQTSEGLSALARCT